MEALAKLRQRLRQVSKVASSLAAHWLTWVSDFDAAELFDDGGDFAGGGALDILFSQRHRLHSWRQKKTAPRAG